MQELLTIKLHNYLAAHHPDRLLALQEEQKLEVYMQEKAAAISDVLDTMLAGDTPAYVVEIHCMDILIDSLGPSKYDYICDLLEDEFAQQYAAFERMGILLYEVLNIIQYSGGLLYGFDEDDGLLRYEVTGAIAEYLNVPADAL